MKNLLKLSMLLLFVTLLMLSSANAKIITIKGHINNLDGKPVANHNVTILSDSSTGNPYLHYRVVKTLADGSYIDTANVPETLYQKLRFIVWTQDCKNEFLSKAIIFNGTPDYIVDFRICDETYHYCVADFYVYSDSIPSDNNLEAKFFDRSQGDNITMHIWTFGDVSQPSSELNPVHIYAKPGIYNVCLTVKSIVNNVELCKSSVCKTVYIKDIPPQKPCKADFVAIRDTFGMAFSFIDRSIGKNITKWTWNFGDGAVSLDRNTKHKFEKPGSYNVCLTIATSENDVNPCQDTYCALIYIPEPPVKNCKASFSVLRDSLDLLSIHFIDKSFGNLISKWHWDFGDNTASDLQYPTHKYEKAGTYNVCLLISSGDSLCYDKFCSVVYVQGTPPPPQKYCKALFYVLKDTAKATFNFFDRSEAKQITSWFWDFGDKQTSPIQNPSHTFASAGTYKVCLSITSKINDTLKCEDSYCYTVFIDSLMPPPPPNKICMNYFTFRIGEKNDTTFRVNFAAFSKSDVPLVYAWDFGDGTRIKVKEDFISHIYQSKGNYNVCLTTFPKDDSLKCSFTSCQPIFGIQDSVFALGSLSGTIFADSNFADAGFVAIIRLNSNNSGNISYIDIVKIADKGAYVFKAVPAGDYYVLAILAPKSIYFKQYMPTFFGDVIKWQQAKPVTIIAKSVTAGSDIHLLKMKPHKKGKCGFSGFVYDGNYDKSAVNTPVSNVEVILFDANDNPLEVTYSDNNGYYKFSEYEYGTYKLQVEVTGMETIAAVVTVDDTNPDLQNINFTVDILKSLALDEALYISDNKYQSLNSYGAVYPNPVSDNAYINIFSKKSGNINIAVYNQLGQIVASDNISIPLGAQTLTVSTAKLGKGIYLIKISEDNISAATRRFIKL